MATKQSIATIKGTFAVPGVSKNRRFYSKEAIAQAVTEAQGMLDSGESLRVSMMTNHGARDPLAGDVTRTAGQVTKVGLNPDGHGTFEAELADTQAGRDVAALTTPDRPYLRGVSMASMWTSTPRQVRVNGETAITADGFSLKGIDFTHNPGVTGAQISSAELNESADEGLIFEELEEVVLEEVITEVVTEAGPYADNGYHGEKAFPLSTPAEIRNAWTDLHRSSVLESYTPKQVNRMRGKVKAQATKAGFDIVAESAATEASITEAAIDDDNEMSPCPACGGDVPAGSNFCPNCGTPISQTESASAGTDKEGANMPTEAATTGEATESTAQTFTLDQVNEIAAKAAAQALESAGVKPTEVVEESDAVKAARALIAEADAGKTATTTTETSTTTTAVTEAAPAGLLTKEEVALLIKESNAEVAKTVTEAVLDVARKEIQESGPRRRGLVSRYVLEQAPEDLYGAAEPDLTKLSIGDMEKLTDSVFSPVLPV